MANKKGTNPNKGKEAKDINPNKGNFSAEEMDAITNNGILYPKEKRVGIFEKRMKELILEKFCNYFTKYECIKVTKNAAKKRKENNCEPLENESLTLEIKNGEYYLRCVRIQGYPGDILKRKNVIFYRKVIINKEPDCFNNIDVCLKLNFPVIDENGHYDNTSYSIDGALIACNYGKFSFFDVKTVLMTGLIKTYEKNKDVFQGRGYGNFDNGAVFTWGHLICENGYKLGDTKGFEYFFHICEKGDDYAYILHVQLGEIYKMVEKTRSNGNIENPEDFKRILEMAEFWKIFPDLYPEVEESMRLIYSTMISENVRALNEEQLVFDQCIKLSAIYHITVMRNHYKVACKWQSGGKQQDRTEDVIDVCKYYNIPFEKGMCLDLQDWISRISYKNKENIPEEYWTENILVLVKKYE